MIQHEYHPARRTRTSTWFRLHFDLLKQVMSPCPKMYRFLWDEYEYQHGIKNPNMMLLLRSYQQKLHYISGQSNIYRVTAVLLLCVKHHAHRNNTAATAPPTVVGKCSCRLLLPCSAVDVKCLIERRRHANNVFVHPQACSMSSGTCREPLP